MSTTLSLRLVAALVVTYGPDFEVLARQCEVLAGLGAVLIFDNGSTGSVRLALRRISSRFSNVRLVESENNLGLAAGINRGVSVLRDECPEIAAILLMDQDSEPESGSVERLVDALNSLSDCDRPICVGPNMLDVDTGLMHGFHCVDGWRWKRDVRPRESPEPVPLANINGSGMLLSLDDFNSIGGMEEMLFIDHVDTEWSFRALAGGGRLFGIPGAVFHHRMGERGRRIWLGGWRVWPERSPLRHFYLFRNAVVLLRRHYVPFVWKVWAVPKLLLTIVIVGVIDSRRLSQYMMMFRGIVSGLSISHSKTQG